MLKTRTKYNVLKEITNRSFDGIVFDSAVEMKYYKDVIMPKIQNGEIVYFERQKKYVLQPDFVHCGKKILPIEYKADFFTIDKNGKETVIDIKGFPDSVAKLKRKMFWYVYPDLDYVWIGYSKKDGGWTTYEDIVSGRKQRKKRQEQQGEKG